MIVGFHGPIPMKVDRARVHAVTGAELWTDERIREALAACDADRAAVLAFARAKAGEPVDAKVVAEILPGVRDPIIAIALLALAAGDRAAAWMEAVRAQRFPVLRGAIETELLVIYAAWRAGAQREEIVRACRRIARFQMEIEPCALLYRLAKELGDKSLERIVADFAEDAESEYGKEGLEAIDKVFKWTLARQLEALPDAPDTAPASKFTVRVAPRVGRNEPCPCGSGQKYKKCCADKDAQEAPSPVQGLSWEAYVTQGADRMSPEDIEALPLRDLARIEIAKLADVPLITAARRFESELRWDRATGAIDEYERRKGEQDGDDLRLELVVAALHAGHLEAAEAQLARVHDRSGMAIEEVELALRRGKASALVELEALAAETLRTGPGSAVVDLGISVMRALPALGILVARGAVDPARPLDNETIADEIENARDALGLPPGDPVWDLLGEPEQENKERDAEAKQLKSSLRATSARVEDLERELKRKQEELKQPKAAGAPVAAQLDRDREKELRGKIDELKSLVTEGNAERAELRRQMATASKAARATDAPSETRAVEEEPAEELVSAVPPRGVSIPVISRRVQDAIAEAPQPVAAEVLRTIGALAAGDPAWRGTKPAQDMPRQVLMGRVGIHYRLLFRIEDGMLHTLDFVTRENLDVTLKRLRTTRG